MEGNHHGRRQTPPYLRRLGALVFFLAALIAAFGIVWYLLGAVMRHSGASDTPRFVTTYVPSGKKVLVDPTYHISIAIPDIFSSQPDPSIPDFYSDQDCRLSIEYADKEPTTTIEQWVTDDSAQREALTVVSSQLSFLSDKKDAAIYTFETAETGLTYVYYQDLQSDLLIIRIYATERDAACYAELARIVQQL